MTGNRKLTLIPVRGHWEFQNTDGHWMICGPWMTLEDLEKHLGENYDNFNYRHRFVRDEHDRKHTNTRDDK